MPSHEQGTEEFPFKVAGLVRTEYAALFHSFGGTAGRSRIRALYEWSTTVRRYLDIVQLDSAKSKLNA